MADPAVDAARPEASNYFPSIAFTEDATTGGFLNVLPEAKSTSSTFTFAADQTGEALYLGLQEEFDGFSIEFLNSLTSGGEWKLEYSKAGGAWGDLAGLGGVAMTDMSETWERPTDWAPVTESGLSVYLVRLVVVDAYPSDITVEQIGLTDYNLVFTAKDQTGASLSEDLDEASFVTVTSNIADDYFAYEKRGSNKHNFALETQTYSFIAYTYSLSIDGYVAARGITSVNKAQMQEDATFDFAYVATLMDGDGTLLSGASVTAGSSSDTCKDLGSGRYGCPVGIDETASLNASKSGYLSLATSFTTDRDAHTDGQVSQSFVMTRSTNTNNNSDGMDLRVRDLEWQDDGDLIVTVINDGDEDVTAAFNFEVEVDDDILYVYEVQSDGDIYLVEEDGRSRSEKIDEISSSEVSAGESEEINLGDAILEDEDETYEVRAEVDTDDDIDEDDEGNNEKTESLRLGGSSSTEDIDLKVTDIQLQDDNDLIVVLENIGDEDVPSSKTVTTRIYVDVIWKTASPLQQIIYRFLFGRWRT